MPGKLDHSTNKTYYIILLLNSLQPVLLQSPPLPVGSRRSQPIWLGSRGGRVLQGVPTCGCIYTHRQCSSLIQTLAANLRLPVVANIIIILDRKDKIRQGRNNKIIIWRFQLQSPGTLLSSNWNITRTRQTRGAADKLRNCSTRIIYHERCVEFHHHYYHRHLLTFFSALMKLCSSPISSS